MPTGGGGVGNINVFVMCLNVECPLVVVLETLMFF